MKALFFKTWRETRVSLLIFGVGFLLFELLLVSIFPSIMGQAGMQFLEIPFVRTIMSSLMGIDLDEGITLRALSAFTWVHPAVLALLWAQVIMFCTRIPAMESDRGTIDMLLSMPVSRDRVWMAETIIWLAAGLVLIVCGLLGALIGTRVNGSEDNLSLAVMLQICCNLYCLYLAVGGLASLFAVMVRRRSHAVGASFALVLASYLLNVIIQIWPPAGALSLFSLMEYYRPFDVILLGAWAWGDMLTLIVLGLGLRFVGGRLFRKKDIFCL